MLCLGIESTAHTFGVGIVTDKGEVLANEVDMYRAPKGWGIKPQEAAQHHKKVSKEVLRKALKKSRKTLKDIDIVSFSQGPGLPPCLWAGLNFARSLHKSLIPVNHCIAHIEIGRLLTKAKYPVTLYVSGGNTQVIAFVSGKYRIFGETQDIGIGNALDKFGRESGLEFPAGPKIEALALKGRYLPLPYVVKGMDLSFSGIVTEALRQLKKGASLEDICFSLQENCFAMLTEVVERALAHTGKEEVLLTGGVAANRKLQGMLEIMCNERGSRFYKCPREFSGDNGAMISWAGILAYKIGQKPLAKEPEILPRQRTDDADIFWIK